VAIAGAAMATDPASPVNLAVERLSSGSGGILAELGDLLPLGFAFAAGMVSAVNPCGFALLPAYLGVFVGQGDPARPLGIAARVRQGLLVGGTVTLAFVLVFTAVGLLVGSAAQVLVGALPWVGLAVGIALVFAGGYRVAGGALYSAVPAQLADRIAGGSPGMLLGGSGVTGSSGQRGYFTFGLAYGLASLSCTLPIFLAVVGSSVAAAEVMPVLGRLVLYGLGMGAVIVGLTLAATLLKAAVAQRLRRTVRLVEPAGTVLLLLAGSYVVYYWLTVGGLLG
jgi:cytochrome c biogenesis protein CcdA